MKKLLLSMAVVAMLFSCSKDSVETETTADLTQSTTEVSTAQEFSGVFGHHLNQDLHGKIYVTVDGNKSQAEIQLVNGDNFKFQGSQINQDTSIYFSGDTGSFSFNALAEQGSRVSDLVINNVNDAYVVTVEVATRGGGWILLGTYEEDGNAAFNGNWDMLGDGVIIDKFGFDAQLVSTVVISHITGLVAIDNTMEPQPGACTGGDPDTFLWDFLGDVATGGNPSAFAHFQSSDVKGPTTSWGVEYRRDQGEQAYVDEDCTQVIASGFWSWRNKTGTILASEPAPFTDGDANRTSENQPLVLE